ncbi:hypothetical protein [Phaeovulum sp. W22_SRMD_FR3]|uniref:hypothetical protein n=1 Tax=Phaeovulum sp. W22_SRMD_FR3 TaxID=3240274 RepID=UPI003F98C563
MTGGAKEMTDEQLYEVALTGKGTPALSCDQLIKFILYLRKINTAGIQSMEAFDFISDTKQPLTFEYSILGLDGDDDWECHQSVARSLNFAMGKIRKAKDSGKNIRFVAWIDDGQ